VVPAQTEFVSRHPRAAASGAHRIELDGEDYALPEGQDGHGGQTLHISVRFDQGRRIATLGEAARGKPKPTCAGDSRSMTFSLLELQEA